MRKQLVTYLLMEQVLRAAEGEEDDFSHVIRHEYLDNMWNDLTEEEQDMLNSREKITECYESLVWILEKGPTMKDLAMQYARRGGDIREILPANSLKEPALGGLHFEVRTGKPAALHLRNGSKITQPAETVEVPIHGLDEVEEAEPAVFAADDSPYRKLYAASALQRIERIENLRLPARSHLYYEESAPFTPEIHDAVRARDSIPPLPAPSKPGVREFLRRLFGIGNDR